MNVVRQPRTSSTWETEIECRGCGAILRILRSDVYVQPRHDMAGIRDRVIVDCCVCKSQVVVQDRSSGNWGELPIR